MKNKFLSRIGQWHTPPYLRKCLTSLNALILLFVMGLSVNVWGETYTISFVKGTSKTGTDINTPLPANASTMCQSGSDYIASFSSDAAYYNASGCGIRIAKSKGDGTFSVTLSDDIQAETVKEVIIYASAVASGNTLDVTPAGTVTTKTTFSSLSTYSASAQISSYAQSAISINGTLTSLTFGATSKKYVHLHQIDIITGDDPTGKDVTITAESELNLTFEESDGTINVTYGEDVADKEVNLFSDASCTTPFSGDWFDAELNSTTGNIDYIAEANTGAAREAYIQIYVMADDAETDNTKVIKVTQAKYAAPTGTFEKFTEDLEEGDYIICSGTTALKNELASNTNYIGYETVAISADKITNPSEALVWHIAQSGDYWTLYNAVVEKYAASTGAKNKGQVIADGTDDKALWTTSESYEFVNKANAASSVNANLRYNSGYGFACYGTGTGSALTLYKKELPAVYSKITLATCTNGSVSVTGAADLTSVASGTTITLGNTPADGYKLDDYDVYKTYDATTKVTVKDGKFKMPAYAVTVSATFSLSIETPVLSEAAGDKDDAINVKVTNYNGDYSYYYTLDGTEPSNASTPYVDADGIAINASCTLKVIAYQDAVTSPVASAAYNLPLMTMDAIFAKATAVGSTATAVRVKFTDCVVTGVKNDNVYLTDNAGKGLIIYQTGHGFVVNDKLNGVVNVQLLLYRGSSEIKGLTSSTDGLTVTKDGSVSPITTIGIASLSGVNTGAVLSYTNLIYDNGHFSDGENTIQPYNTFTIADYPDFADGDKYNVTGVYIQYNTTKEIAPRSLDDLEKIEATKYAINLATVEHGTIATYPETEAADGVKVTLSATPAAGYMLGEWSVVDAESNPVEVTANQFTMPAMAVTVSATFVELPIWATTYTSNVTVGTATGTSASEAKVLLAEEYQPDDYPEDGYEANKAGSSKVEGDINIEVPAGTYELHYHAAAWSSKSETLYVQNGSSPVAEHSILADAGLSNNSPFTLENNPVDEYYMIKFEPALTEQTTLTFSASSNRFILFGVNAIQPAAITIDPASKDFGEVKQGFDAEQVFTLTPNAFATGTITAEIDGDDVFTASAVADNKVTVTFAPTEITEYSATLIIKHDGTQMCTAALSGKGITPTTPEIVVSDDEIDFGKVKQDATIADQAVTVTLSYLDAATASIDDDTYFSIDKTDLVAGENTITISAKATASGTKNATITITGTGATTKTISVKMDVTSKWAGDYNTDACITMSSSQNAKVVIDEEEYPAVKANDGANATITLPEGVTNLYFHAAAWNGEAVTLTAYKGTTTEESNKLGEFILVSDGGVKSSSPYTLQGENYDTDQYFHIDDLTDITEGQVITFVPNDNRYVIYGVHQEGGVLPVLDHITIDGEATKLNYNTTDAFDPVGLTVSAVYTLKGVEQTPVPVTENVNWTFDPATFNEVGEGLSVTATASFTDGEVTKTADKEITGISVEEATPSIFASKVNIEFGEVIQGATVEPIQSKITLKYIDEVSVTLSDATAFEIDKTSMTETGYLTISAVTTAEVGEYTATVTIKDLASETSKVLNLSITIKEAPQAESYTLVTDASTLKAGDIVVMAATYNDVTYVNGGLSGDLLTCIEATVTDDVLSAAGACEFVLGGEEGAWTLTSADGTLGATAVKKLTYDDAKAGFVGTWTISISNNVATIAPDAEGYGRFMYNHNNGGNRFLTYTSNTSASMLLPQLYRKPVYEAIRTDMTDGQIGTGCQTKNILDVKGATLYQVNYTYGCYLEFMEVTYPVEAGMPIIMQADGTNGGKVEVLYGNEVATEGKNKYGLFGYIGADTYNIPEGYPYYVFKGGMLRPSQGNYTTSGHAYIKLDEVPTTDQTEGSPAPRRRLSVGIERSMPTGFETIMMQKGMNKVIMNNQLYLIRDGKLFNAQGALVK